ncbi:cyclic nucleotide-binding domain-containing protein [Motilimonas cestriensis]|uniref:histidine kinase n=1 Tax=Motilimonas cestriensis TaxID=2742685 RepID=A0ABS8WC32_9GAMM|nr:ATP-binding protein [Motilimonas cestriensis]MCE2595151.1 cyclic nucleotide-binding domain-containing protein [Motilimonas cestriensis]
MTHYAIVCIHSDANLLLDLQLSLGSLASHFHILLFRDVKQADDHLTKDQPIAMLISELTPQSQTYLVAQTQLQNRPKCLVFNPNEPSLLINLINLGHVDHVIATPQMDLETVKGQLSQFLQQQNETLTHYADVLDTTQLKSASFPPQGQFLDYSLYSDNELSNLVINALYRVFSGNDEHHVCRKYSKNHLLTREGEHNNALWFIADGEVQLKKHIAAGQEQEVTVMRAGSMVGGMSFITGEPAFTTSITLTGTEVIKLEKSQFATLMKSNSELLGPFTHLLLRNFNRRLQSSIITKLKLQSTLQSLDAAHAQLVETEKMAVLGQLVAGIAHELNNPVAAILRGADTLKQKVPSLLAQEISANLRQLGATTLNNAMKITPLSTAITRQKTKAAIPLFGSNALARKAVQMQLDSPEQFAKYFAPLGSELTETIQQLDTYYLVGNFLRSIDVCAKRIADLVKGLKHYAGQDIEQAVFSDLHEGLEETLVIFENRLKSYQVIKEYGDIPLVQCHPIELQQIWTNLIANAIDATQGEGEIKLHSHTMTKCQQDFVCISIEDNGIGIPEEKKARIFELNYTTKREGNFGLGIGLTVCQQIVKRHHGEIKVISSNDAQSHFTRFEVYLPVNNPEIKQRSRAENEQEA